MSEKKDNSLIAGLVIGWILVGIIVAFLAGMNWQKDRDLEELTARKVTMDRLVTELAEAKARLAEERTFVKTWEGVASFYGKESGIVTSIGEPFDGTDFTAAHRSLPPGTLVIVESLETGLSTVCRINDVGPSKKYPERIIDVSDASASILGMTRKGLTHVRVHQIRLPKGD